MNRAKQSIIALCSISMLSACVSQKSYNFREIASNPHALEGRHAKILMTNDKVIEMDVESIQGNHLYGEGKYVPISVIKSAQTTKRGLPEIGGPGGLQSPVNINEMPSFLMAGIILTFPVLIVLGITSF